MKHRLVAGLLAVTLCAAAPLPAIAQTPIMRVMVLETKDAEAYADAVAEGKEILARLGSTAEIHVWRARFAGGDTGTVIVTIEWPSLAAMAAYEELIAGSAEMAEWMSGLGELRKILSDSIYQELDT